MKKPDFWDKHGFICDLSLKELNIHINLICFAHNFDHLHINVVTFDPRKQFKKLQFFHKNIAFVEKVFDMYVLLSL